MIKKIICFVVVLSASIFAASPVSDTGNTVVDTLLVPIRILRNLGNGVYTGKVSYNLTVGSNDSLAIKLEIVPVGGGTTIVPEIIAGNVGIQSPANGINGQNDIFFKCTIAGTPAAYYQARLTINANLSNVETMTNSIISQMTQTQKDQQLSAASASTPRMGADVSIGGTTLYGWYASNGGCGPCAGSSGTATTFPTPGALACTFDTAMNYTVGQALAKEFWAKSKFVIEGPVCNMVRDPRGGRSWETFSEDPYLSGKCIAAWVRGAQSTGATAMPKHFVCNDWENNRATVDINPISERTLREIYCMPFEYAVREGKAWAIMTAYPSNNGNWCTENAHLQTDIIKNGWVFRGFTFSDWGAMHSTAPAANAGQDIELPYATYFGSALVAAVPGQVSQARFDDMARRMVRTKLINGVYGGTTTRFTSDLESAAQRTICLAAAHESIVLVKNDGTLPIDKTKKVAVVGNYTGFLSSASGSGTMIGCTDGNTVSPLQGIQAKMGSNVVAAASADVVIACYGVAGEGEGHDRTTLSLDNPDVSLLTSAHAAGAKTVVVLTCGSAAIDGTWETNADAIVVEWYPGEMQGTALADILFGDVNPSGKLSSQWPETQADLPTFIDNQSPTPYEGPDTGRGYRYSDRCNKTPLFAFGLGLSYTTFAYSNIRISPSPAYVGDLITVTVNVKNTGSVAGDQIAELYVHEVSPTVPRPVKELRGFVRTGILAPGAATDVSFALRERELAYWNTTLNKFAAQADHYTIMVGPSSKASDLTLQADLNLQAQ
jgi:beta-glucosidase